jgi:two-component system sensor histidine kinase KdpD
MNDSNREAPRPSPDALLRDAAREGKGRLKIFLGAAPGVGKTYKMLTVGAARLHAGVDVVVAVVETHGRAETEALVAPFEIVPRRQIEHRGHILAEMDLDAVLARAPKLALVDELAHSNAEGSRHPKRWQDVAELIDAGIDVYTTLNVQHVESLTDVVASFTKVRVRETVPDSVFEHAEIEVIDLPPDELIQRLEDGKVYVPDEASRALGHFFSKPNLSALRELALRKAAESVDKQMLEHLDAFALPGTFAGGERVLVAVSEQPGMDRLVRVGKRLADALRAPWTAAYIETPRAQTFGEAQKRVIADALRLAASLGATIATVPAETVMEGLRAQIEGLRATQLVIGKSRRSWWFEMRHGSVVDAMLRISEGLAVHVIPAEAAAPRSSASGGGVRNTDLGGAADYAAIAGLIGGTTLVAHLLEPFIGVNAIDLIYLAPVILAAALFGMVPGIVTGIVGALAYNFFFLEPRMTFTVEDPQAVIALFVLVGIAAFTARLTGRLKTRATLGVRSAHENAAVAAFAQTLARVSDRESTALAICQEVSHLLDVDSILLAEQEGALEIVAAWPEGATLGPVDRAAADWAWSRGEQAGNGTATLNAADWLFAPLKTSLGTLAVLGLARENGREPVPADRAVLMSALVGQAALAHERLHLENDMRQVSVLKARDRTRMALLSSIGQDLRKPLKRMQGALAKAVTEDPASKPLAQARREADRMIRFIGNLADLVKVDSGELSLVAEPTDLADAVSAAAHDIHDILRDVRIDLDVPSKLPPVRVDPQLLHNVLVHLLANSAPHGGDEGVIGVEGRRTPDAVLLTVRDRGPGLAPGREDAVFGALSSVEEEDSGGLGLAIVKAFAEAMGIEVSALNHPDGGAAYTLRFGETLIGQAEPAPAEAAAEAAPTEAGGNDPVE